MKEDNHIFGKLPDHLLIEIFVRIPVCEWAQVSSVRKHWASIFQGECLWQTAINRTWPSAGHRKRWPGPIPRGLARRRYAALYVSEHIVVTDGEVDELVGQTYLFLKEQLELSALPSPSSILHGTIIGRSGATLLSLMHGLRRIPKDTILAHFMKRQFPILEPAFSWMQALIHIVAPSDALTSLDYGADACISIANYLQNLNNQFIACGKTRDKAHELASRIWLAVIDNLEENEHTFLLLKRLVQEGDFFLPYPYSRSDQVIWRVLEKLFTDFRDCFNSADYYDVLTSAKSMFQPVPSSWLGY